MSSANSSPGQNLGYAVNFPDAIPAGVDVDVPQPFENYPDWTSIPYSSADVPPMFKDLIEMPDYQTEPALYAAAADTIRMTNTYFQLTGSYSSERSMQHPLTQDLCKKKLDEWAELPDGDGIRGRLAPVQFVTRPPDPRSLFVKENMGDPSDEKLQPLWIKAFKEVEYMSDLTWIIYLGYTRQQLIDQANSRDPRDEAWLVSEIFKRYMVWDELWEGHSNRATRFEQKQPTWTELEDYFNREHVRKEGVTLVDICHAFPRARDAQMLLYRIEHFATLKRQPSFQMDDGIEDPVESKYMFRPPPSSQVIKEAASNRLRHKGSSVSLKELADLYLPFRVHHRLIRNVLGDLGAQPDTTSGRYTLRGNVSLRREMRKMMEQESTWYLNGVTLQDIARPFRSQARDRESFLQTVYDLYFFDKDEKRYFPLSKDEHDGRALSPEHSLIARDKARIRTLIGQPDLMWDRGRLKYVPRANGSRLGETDGANRPFLDHGSPTDTVADTVAGETPPPESTNSMGMITAWEIEPISPRAESFAPLAPAASVSAEALPDPSVEEPAAGRSPAIAEPDESGQGKKRGPAEESLESSKGKKRRKNPKIRCSRKTVKNTRCKKQKDNEDGEQEWDCGAHKQS